MPVRDRGGNRGCYAGRSEPEGTRRDLLGVPARILERVSVTSHGRAGALEGPSPNLSWVELACKDGTPYPAEWRISRALGLAVEFERVRKLAGRPLTILSGYRSPAHNRRVGGTRASQHVQGRALDLLAPADWTPLALFGVVRSVAGEADSKIRGLGLYPWGVHMDIRESDRLVVWGGTRAEADK